MTMDASQIIESQLSDGTAYDLFVPPTCNQDNPPGLLVSVLPVYQTIPRYRAITLFSEFATSDHRLVLAPRVDIKSGFQALGLGTPERHDLKLLQMVDIVVSSHSLGTPVFDLFGYSAGGQLRTASCTCIANECAPSPLARPEQ